jgi:hypothetical protein
VSASSPSAARGTQTPDGERDAAHLERVLVLEVVDHASDEIADVVLDVTAARALQMEMLVRMRALPMQRIAGTEPAGAREAELLEQCEGPIDRGAVRVAAAGAHLRGELVDGQVCSAGPLVSAFAGECLPHGEPRRGQPMAVRAQCCLEVPHVLLTAPSSSSALGVDGLGPSDAA